MYQEFRPPRESNEEFYNEKSYNNAIRIQESHYHKDEDLVSNENPQTQVSKNK